MPNLKFPNKKTKIIATLGPASESVEKIIQMINAGMNAARLNFSHGTYENHKKLIKNIRQAAKKTGQQIAIIQDLQGPKIRVGNLPESGIIIKAHDKITLTTAQITGNEKLIPIQFPELPRHVKKNDEILLCDGAITLNTISVQRQKGLINCEVIHGGIIKSHKGINVPQTEVDTPALTEKDLQDIAFGLKNDVDFIAISFVKNAQEIRDLRKIISSYKKSAKIIAKIERPQAVENMEEIIKETDCIMVARGDLGVELKSYKVPIIQKRLIKTANTYSVPVITATEILQSMVENSRATRAEVSDCANAILDQTDCVMLSNESAVGAYPVEAVETLSLTATETEKFLEAQNRLRHTHFFQETDQVNALCFATCRIAKDIHADFIVLVTSSGFTAQEVSKHRPFTPIITLTTSEKTMRELSLTWGINQKHLIKFNPHDTDKIIKFLLKSKLITPKQEIVICNTGKKSSFIKVIKV
jgi:pyruvate kinase